jgi:hypothetical protein
VRSAGRVRGLPVISRFSQRSLNRPQHAFHRIVNVIVLNPHNAISKVSQKQAASSVTLFFVIRRVSCAVDFNDEQGFAANEIGNVAANRSLADEFEALKLPVP